MLVHKKKRVLVLKPRNPEHITTTIPTAKTFEYKGATMVAVPHKLDEVRVLRNMGIKAPSPILYYYDWSRNVHTVPKPFFAQTETAAFLTVHPRSFVLSGLGSGKTLSSLWSYDYLRSIGERKRVLVVSTLSTLDRAWGDTIFEHFPHLTFSVLHGSKEKRLKLLNQLVDIYIINHDGLKVIGDAFAERPDIDMVIVDEVSEAARNAQTDRWKSLNEVVNKQPVRMKLPPRYCIGLTATPVPNDPTDAWAQCRLITPDTVPPYFNRFKDMVMRQSGPYNWLPRDNVS